MFWNIHNINLYLVLYNFPKNAIHNMKLITS